MTPAMRRALERAAKRERGNICPMWLVVAMALAFICGLFFFLISFALASADRRSENVGIHAVIIAELKLRNIERQILAADLLKEVGPVRTMTAKEAAKKVAKKVGRSETWLRRRRQSRMLINRMRICGVQAGSE